MTGTKPCHYNQLFSEIGTVETGKNVSLSFIIIYGIGIMGIKERKKAVVVGASSGIGYEVALQLLDDNWTLGVAARRTELLAMLADKYQGRVVVESIDVTDEKAGERLHSLIGRLGGMDMYVHVAGIGYQNMELDLDKELSTVCTNALGFTRLVGEAYRYFIAQGYGHIVAVSSIAGTKGLGAAPAYSASKAFDSTYVQALEQQACMRGCNIRFTDIRPGFVRTDLLADGKYYPMLMDKRVVAKKIIKAIGRHRHVCIIDWRYALLTFLWRLVPLCVWRRMNIHS